MKKKLTDNQIGILCLLQEQRDGTYPTYGLDNRVLNRLEEMGLVTASHKFVNITSTGRSVLIDLEKRQAQIFMRLTLAASN